MLNFCLPNVCFNRPSKGLFWHTRDGREEEHLATYEAGGEVGLGGEGGGEAGGPVTHRHQPNY